MEEIIAYYLRQGAPSDQNALVNMLKEIQQECGGFISQSALKQAAEACHVKESFLQAVVKRYPSLKIDGRHCLEICGGPNCGKCRELADLGERLQKQGKILVKFVPCMRLCGKGPNIKLDGKLYHQADAELIEKITAPYV